LKSCNAQRKLERRQARHIHERNMMHSPRKPNPANDVLAFIMNLVGLTFGLICLWMVVSVSRL
jgi:hypothetical protein